MSEYFCAICGMKHELVFDTISLRDADGTYYCYCPNEEIFGVGGTYGEAYENMCNKAPLLKIAEHLESISYVLENSNGQS